MIRWLTHFSRVYQCVLDESIYFWLAGKQAYRIAWFLFSSLACFSLHYAAVDIITNLHKQC